MEEEQYLHSQTYSGQTNLNVFDEIPVGCGQKFIVDEYPPDYDPQSGNQVDKDVIQSLRNRVKSKVFKIRQNAYNELFEEFNKATDDDIFAEYAKDMIAIITDPNPAAQEKGLECLQILIDKCQNLQILDLSEIQKCIIDKCIGAGKPAIKKLGNDCIVNLFDKCDKQITFGSINEALTHKLQKTNIGGLNILIELLNQYGPKKMNFMKPFYANIDKLAASTQIQVRNEALEFYKEVYKWIGDALKPFINKLKKAQVDELEKFFKEYQKEVKIPVRGVSVEELSITEKSEQYGQFDAYEICEPVEIFNKFNENWCDKVLNQLKWSEKKRMLEELANAANIVKISPTGSYHVVQMLKRLLNDSNIAVVGLAIKIFGILAKGIRRQFRDQSKNLCNLILQKLKDKKLQIVEEALATLEHMLHCINIDEVLEDVKECLNDKNPSLKIHTLSWIDKFLMKNIKGSNKISSLGKNLTPILKKCFDDSDSGVRDISLQVLGKFRGIIGEQFMANDIKLMVPQKINKIKESAKIIQTLKTQPQSSHLNNSQSNMEIEKKILPNQNNQSTRSSVSNSQGLPKNIQQQSTNQTNQINQTGNNTQNSNNQQQKQNQNQKDGKRQSLGGIIKQASKDNINMDFQTPSQLIDLLLQSAISSEEAQARLIDLGLPINLINGLQDSNWKSRQQCLIDFYQWVSNNALGLGAFSEHIVKYLKTILKEWKEPNLNLMKEGIATLQKILDNNNIILDKKACFQISTLITEKIQDSKFNESCNKLVESCIKAIGDGTIIEYIVALSSDSLSKVNPKSIIEILNMFGKIDNLEFVGKKIFDFSKSQLNSQNQQIKISAQSLIKILYIKGENYIPNSLIDVNPQISKVIINELEKVKLSSDNQLEANKKKFIMPPTRENIQNLQQIQSEKQQLVQVSEQQSLPQQNQTNRNQMLSMAPEMNFEISLKQLQNSDFQQRADALSFLEKFFATGDVKSAAHLLENLLFSLKSRIYDPNLQLRVRFFGLLRKIIYQGLCRRESSIFVLPSLLQNFDEKDSQVQKEAKNLFKEMIELLGWQMLEDLIQSSLTNQTSSIKLAFICWLEENCQIWLNKIKYKILFQFLSETIFLNLQVFKSTIEKLFVKIQTNLGNIDFSNLCEQYELRKDISFKEIINKITNNELNSFKQQGSNCNSNQNTQDYNSRQQRLQNNPQTHQQNNSNMTTASNNGNCIFTISKSKLERIKLKAQYNSKIQVQNNVFHTNSKVNGLDMQDEDDLTSFREELKNCFRRDILTKMTSYDPKNIFEALELIKINSTTDLDNFIESFDLVLTWITILFKKFTIKKDTKRIFDFLEKIIQHLHTIKYKPIEEEIQIMINMTIEEIDRLPDSIDEFKGILQNICQFVDPQKFILNFLSGIRKYGQVKSEFLELVQQFAEIYSTHPLQPSDFKLLGRLLMSEDPLIVSQTQTIFKTIWIAKGEDFIRKAIDLPNSMVENFIASLKLSESKMQVEQQYQPNQQEEQMLVPTNFKQKINNININGEKANKNLLDQCKTERNALISNTSNINITKLDDLQAKIDEELLERNLRILVNGTITLKIDSIIFIQDACLSEQEDTRKISRLNSDKIFESFRILLGSIYQQDKTSKEQFPYQFIIFFMTSLSKICSVKTLMKTLKAEEVLKFLDEVLNRLVQEDEDRERNKEQSDNLVKMFNSVVLKMLENSNANHLFSALFAMLRNNRKKFHYTKLIGLVMKCILKLVKIMESLIHQINPEILLHNCHLYIIDSALDASRMNEDLGIKIIKAIVNEIVRLSKDNIWNYYKYLEMNGPPDQHIKRWITYALKTQVIVQNKMQQQPPRPIPIQVANPIDRKVQTGIPPYSDTLKQHHQNINYHENQNISTQQPRKRIQQDLGYRQEIPNNFSGYQPSQKPQEDYVDIKPEIKCCVDKILANNEKEASLQQLYDLLETNPTVNLLIYLKDTPSDVIDKIIAQLEAIKAEKNFKQQKFIEQKNHSQAPKEQLLIPNIDVVKNIDKIQLNQSQVKENIQMEEEKDLVKSSHITRNNLPNQEKIYKNNKNQSISQLQQQYQPQPPPSHLQNPKQLPGNYKREQINLDSNPQNLNQQNLKNRFANNNNNLMEEQIQYSESKIKDKDIQPKVDKSTLPMAIINKKENEKNAFGKINFGGTSQKEDNNNSTESILAKINEMKMKMQNIVGIKDSK